MELKDLKPISEKLFQIMPQEDFIPKDASDIEAAAQALVNQLATVLMQYFVFPAEIKEIHHEVAAGSLRCPECNQQLRLHKQDEPLHLKTIFGKKSCYHAASILP